MVNDYNQKANYCQIENSLASQNKYIILIFQSWTFEPLATWPNMCYESRLEGYQKSIKNILTQGNLLMT